MNTLLSEAKGAPQRASVPWFAIRGQRWLPLVGVFAAAVILRCVAFPNTDVSWLITVAEKILDGQRLYFDVIEINPPASVFLYLPAVAFARLAGLRPELAVDALVFSVAGLSLWLTGRIAIKASILTSKELPGVAAFAAAILTILPAYTFGEREHIAAILLLPVFAVLCARARDQRPDLVFVCIAGVCAGLTMVIKPYFAVVIASAVLVSAAYARSWRPIIGIENWIAGAILVLYAACVVIFYPAFITDTVPMVNVLYFPIRNPWLVLLSLPAIPFALLGALAVIVFKRSEILAPRYALLLTGAGAFAAVFFLQGKGWPYHSYPMIALVLLALGLTIAERAHAAAERMQGMFDQFGLPLLAAGIFAGGWVWFNVSTDMNSLVEPIRGLKPHPTMLTLSSDISLGHPLVRMVGGRWVGSVGSLWVTGGAIIRRKNGPLDRATAALIAGYEQRDRQMLVEDIQRNAPDIILAESNSNWRGWVSSDPALQEALAHYSSAAIVDGVEILRRDGQK